MPLILPTSLTVNKGDLIRFLCYVSDKHKQFFRFGFKNQDGSLSEGIYVFNNMIEFV